MKPSRPRPILGPITSAELHSIGIESVESLIAMGWEEAFLRWIEAYPERLNLNAAVGLIAAIEGIPWLEVHPNDKARARVFIDGLRRERGQKPTSTKRRRPL
jgi:hypothetical protein